MRGLEKSCVVSLPGVPFSIVMYGLSRADILADAALAVVEFERRGVEVGHRDDVVVADGRLVPRGLPSKWSRARGETVHFSHCGRGAR
jgi:hypothetical protein